MANRTLIRTDRNGTKYYRAECSCWKCGGTGTYQWGAIINGCPSFAGVCFNCGGTGIEVETVKEYTPEHQAKLDAQRAKRAAKREAEEAAKRAEEEAKRAAEEAERARKQAEREAQWAKERAQSEYVGEVGQKITLEVYLNFETSYKTDFGTTYIYSFKDDNGNTFVWKTSSILWIEELDEKGSNIFIRKGDKISLTATIKAHQEYRDEKQTLIQRVRKVHMIQKKEQEG